MYEQFFAAYIILHEKVFYREITSHGIGFSGK